MARRPGRRLLSVASPGVERPGRTEPEGAGPYRFARQTRHVRPVGFGGRFTIGAALAHDVDPQRRVADLRRDVGVVRPLRQRVEIVRKALPVPREALSQHRSEAHTSELQSLMRTSYAV